MLVDVVSDEDPKTFSHSCLSKLVSNPKQALKDAKESQEAAAILLTNFQTEQEYLTFFRKKHLITSCKSLY